MTGWNESGHAVKTGLPIDKYLGSGDLQDAENCGYAPVSVLGELGVDTSHGDPQVQYRDGRIVLLDGTVLELGGTFNCVWAVTTPPAYAVAAYERGVAEGLKRAATAVRAQAGLPDLVHFNRPSDFRKGVLTCLAALESLATKATEEAPDA